MKNLLRLIRMIMSTRDSVPTKVSHATLPSSREDFNGDVYIDHTNLDGTYSNALRLTVALPRFMRAAFSPLVSSKCLEATLRIVHAEWIARDRTEP